MTISRFFFLFVQVSPSYRYSEGCNTCFRVQPLREWEPHLSSVLNTNIRDSMSERSSHRLMRWSISGSAFCAMISWVYTLQIRRGFGHSSFKFLDFFLFEILLGDRVIFELGRIVSLDMFDVEPIGAMNPNFPWGWFLWHMVLDWWGLKASIPDGVDCLATWSYGLEQYAL